MEAIVLDPLKSGWGKKTVYARNADDLLEMAKSTTQKILVVDEASMSLDKYDLNSAWLATTSRHLGHVSIFIGHRITNISPNIRGQCTQVFIFHCETDDAIDLVRQFDEPELRKTTKLPKLHFIRIRNFEGMQRGRVDPGAGKIFMEKP